MGLKRQDISIGLCQSIISNFDGLVCTTKEELWKSFLNKIAFIEEELIPYKQVFVEVCEETYYIWGG
jgi:hypothetical protein